MTEANLGETLRRLRDGQGLSLRSLAERTGFSASFLSQVENGHASPSIASMERIANALGVTVGQLFDGAAANTASVVRSGDRVVLNSHWSRARLESLGAADDSVRMEPVLLTIEAGGTSGTRAFASPHEEFALVLEGTVVLTLGTDDHTLGAGDGVTIRPGSPRRWQNPGADPVRLLLVSAR